MSGFVKLDDGMLDSSLWAFRDDRSLFITALLMARPIILKNPLPQLSVRSLEPTGWIVPAGRYGLIAAAGIGIVRRDGIEEEEGYKALERLCSPDAESRSHDFEGRRLARVDGGYIVLNYMRFRDRDYTTAERSKAYRDRRRDAGVTARDDGRDESHENSGDRDESVTPMPSASASGRSGVEETTTTKELEGRDDLRDYCTRLAVAANKGLGHEIPRILASSGSTLQTAEILAGADIPIEFAEMVIFVRARALGVASRDVRSLHYFTRLVCEEWEREEMKGQVERSPLAPGARAKPTPAAQIVRDIVASKIAVRLCPVCDRMLDEAGARSHVERKHADVVVPPFAEWSEL